MGLPSADPRGATRLRRGRHGRPGSRGARRGVRDGSRPRRLAGAAPGSRPGESQSPDLERQPLEPGSELDLPGTHWNRRGHPRTRAVAGSRASADLGGQAPVRLPPAGRREVLGRRAAHRPRRGLHDQGDDEPEGRRSAPAQLLRLDRQCGGRGRPHAEHPTQIGVFPERLRTGEYLADPAPLLRPGGSARRNLGRRADRLGRTGCGKKAARGALRRALQPGLSASPPGSRSLRVGESGRRLRHRREDRPAPTPGLLGSRGHRPGRRLGGSDRLPDHQRQRGRAGRAQARRPGPPGTHSDPAPAGDRHVGLRQALRQVRPPAQLLHLPGLEPEAGGCSATAACARRSRT